MKTDATYIDPEEYEIKITISMKSKDWIELSEQLRERWPSCELQRQIGNVVRALRSRVGINEDMEKPL